MPCEIFIGKDKGLLTISAAPKINNGALVIEGAVTLALKPREATMVQVGDHGDTVKIQRETQQSFVLTRYSHSPGEPSKPVYAVRLTEDGKYKMGVNYCYSLGKDAASSGQKEEAERRRRLRLNQQGQRVRIRGG